MTGADHYKEAERILAFVAQQKKKLAGQTLPHNEVIAQMSVLNAEMNEAQVHATLAIAAAMRPSYEA